VSFSCKGCGGGNSRYVTKPAASEASANVDRGNGPERDHPPASVLYMHHAGGLSGSAISLRNILLALDRARFQPRVLLAADGPVRALYEDLSVPVDVVPMRPFWTFPGPCRWERAYWHNWLSLAPTEAVSQYLAQLRPSLVHLNDKALLGAGISAHRLGIPIVWHLRSTYHVSSCREQAAASRCIIRRLAHRVIAISEDEMDGFEDLGSLRVIYNSVDFAAADQAASEAERVRGDLGVAPGEIAFGMVGVLNEQKGAWDFIKAAGMVQAKLPDVRLRFFLVGPGSSRSRRRLGIRERLRLVDTTDAVDKAWQLARAAGISSRLALTGYRPDALAVMAAMDVIVSYNRLGVLGRQPFEAMAVGRPVIVNSGHTGKSGVVVDGVTAVVVPPCDPEALAAAMVRLARSPELRRQMGVAGAQYARRHFDPATNARKLERVYEEVLRLKS